MTRAQLFDQIKSKSSFLCIGLDTDIQKIPEHLLEEEDPILTFNKAIIEATHDLCVAYKPNIAFYECNGAKGWETLSRSVDAIPENVFTIADAKRGDIGNTSRMYARTFFEQYAFDSVTVAPYMGEDSVTPFLEYSDKWTILLALTSNKGANDFQMNAAEEQQLFERVLERSAQWGTPDNLMFVAGATRGELLRKVRKLVPDHFLLVPGVGAQGGSLAEVSQHAMNDQCGLLVNASRSILYASKGKDFQEAARQAALDLQQEMKEQLSVKGLI